MLWQNDTINYSSLLGMHEKLLEIVQVGLKLIVLYPFPSLAQVFVALFAVAYCAPSPGFFGKQ